MADLHYTEIALRNKFDPALAAQFGAAWYNDPGFLAIVDRDCAKIVRIAIKNASKHLAPGQHLLPGKVISELTFGFWQRLTGKPYEHSLWTPYLSKSFQPRKPPVDSPINWLFCHFML